MVRSFTQRGHDGAVGDGDKYQQPGNPFGWTSWYLARKSSDFHSPGPSEVWVFTDEHPDSLDDALLYSANYATSPFIELPGCQHGGACGMAYADGHAEIHKWHGQFANVPVIYSQASGVRQRVNCSLTDPDMQYFAAQHAD